MQINDCKLAFFRANGATSPALQDAQREWLALQGFTDETNQDLLSDYLRSQGYVGSYSDMSTQFWIDQGCYE